MTILASGKITEDVPCPSVPWFFGIPWLILSKGFPWLFVLFLCIFQGFSGFAGDTKSLVNLRFFLGKTQNQGKEGQGKERKDV